MTAISLQAVVNGQLGNAWNLQSSKPDPIITGKDLVAGFPEIELVVGANDPALWSGAREQIIHSLSPGDDFFTGRWVSCAFKLRNDYKPQRSSSWPNWNAAGICLHDNGYRNAAGNYMNAPQAQFGMGIYTKDEDKQIVLTEPHLGCQFAGGLNWPNWWSTSKRFIHPEPIKLDHVYVVDVFLKLGLAAEVWLDGQVWVPRFVPPPNWLIPEGPDAGKQMNVYYVLENYRPPNVMLQAAGQPLVTWDQVMSYCGVKSGATRDEATLYQAAVPTPAPVPTVDHLGIALEKLDSGIGHLKQTTNGYKKMTQPLPTTSQWYQGLNDLEAARAEVVKAKP